MSIPPAIFDSFIIERTFSAAVPRVFAAWAHVETKARWFTLPPEQWQLHDRELDFRVGGLERMRGRFFSQETVYAARYHAIVPGERLVYAYDMHVSGRHVSVSLATVEFAPAGGGTRMIYTEQIAFLDGENGRKSREEGTAAFFERLGTVLG